MEFIVNSVLNSITYIIPVGNQKDCWLVDCGDIDKIVEQGWHVRGVLLTHSHFDHIYGLNRLMVINPDALVYTNEAGKEGLLNPKWNFSRYHDEVEDFIFMHPENIRIINREGLLAIEEDLTVEVLFTPGHEPSCITYKSDNCLFTGDSYIPGAKTITNFPRSVKSISEESEKRLKALESYGYEIKAGHIENDKRSLVINL